MTNTEINPNIDFLGTCPVCFGEHVVRKGGMIKHGWTEQGGREVGVYGKAWHSGECFAVGCLPFEVSCETTKTFLDKVARPSMVQWAQHVAELNTRPVLTVAVTEYAKDEQGHIVYKGRKAVTVTTYRECSETNEFGSEYVDYSKTTRYEKELKSAIRTATMFLNQATANVAFLENKIATWAPAELQVYTPKATVVHYKVSGGRMTFCGSKNVLTTDDRTATTCTRCLSAIAKRDEEKAAQNQVHADRDLVLSFIKSAPAPVTAKEIRTALDMDIKRFNKAIRGYYDHGVTSSWKGKTEMYHACV